RAAPSRCQFRRLSGPSASACAPTASASPGWSIAKRRCDMNAAAKIHGERSITLTRLIKAPRALVWKTWTDKEMLRQWWGPEMFTNPVVQGDVKVGGSMHITMHGPKDTPFDRDFPMTKRYVEIVPNSRLVFENN